MITPNEILTEAGKTILRSELGKLMRIARIARPGAIYDASAAAQTFPNEEMVGFLTESIVSSEDEARKKILLGRKRKKISNICRDSQNSK